MEERKNKRPSWMRRKFLINEHFQLHFIAFTAIISLSACVFFYVASSWFFMRYHEFAVEVGLRPSDPFFRVLYNMEMMLTQLFVGTSIAVVFVTLVGGLIFSHRVAGPMYRLRKHLEAVARGETWADVTFRKNDYFVDVADAYNAQMHQVRQKLGIDVATADTGPMAMRDKVPGENPAEMKYQDPVNVSTATEAVAEPKAEGESVAAAGDGEGEEFKKAG